MSNVYWACTLSPLESETSEFEKKARASLSRSLSCLVVAQCRVFQILKRAKLDEFFFHVLCCVSVLPLSLVINFWTSWFAASKIFCLLYFYFKFISIVWTMSLSPPGLQVCFTPTTNLIRLFFFCFALLDRCVCVGLFVCLCVYYAYFLFIII